MNAQDFCFWLQGFFEVRGEPGALSAAQVEVIQNHLNLVFKHDIDPKKNQETSTPVSKLNQAHGGHSTLRC